MNRFLLAVLALVALVPDVHADGVIQIRLSFKAIRNAFSGAPAGPDQFTLDQAIGRLNEEMLRNNAAYRFMRVDPLIEVGGGSDERPNPSHYYQMTLGQTREEMLSDALANQSQWAWNPAAVNVYFNLVGGSNCPFPCGQLILIEDVRSARGDYYLHEIGEYFNLCKTQGCTCESCSGPVPQGLCFTVPGDDGVSDTLPDVPEWDLNQSALFNFGVVFAELSPTNQERVRDVYYNALSDRGDFECSHVAFEFTYRLTQGQLDRWADAASTTRAAVCDGRVFYVMAGAGGTQNGRSTNPFDRVAEGLSAAGGGGDIVMIRTGNYPERFTISTPVTLRAPRGHAARIGQ